MLYIALLFSSCFAISMVPEFAQASDLTVGNYELVSSKRITRTVWEYSYRASVTNTGTNDVRNVIATAKSNVPGLTMISNSLSFGSVSIGTKVKSSSTFTIRVNRQYSLYRKDLDWRFAFDYVGAKFIPGTNSPVTSGQIGTAGGMIQALEGPIAGIKIQIPESALLSDNTVSLGYNNGTLYSSSPDVFSGIVLSLDLSPEHAFDKPLIVTVPFNDDGTIIPMPYYIDLKGKLHPVELVNIDRVAKEFSFATFHASLFTWFFGEPVYAPSPDDILQTDYRPENDGFQIPNIGSIYQKDGECFGMATFSNWYYLNKKKSYGNFYPKYFDIIVG